MNGFDDSHLTDRARAWAATMHGHDLGEVVRAHTDSAAAVGAGEPKGLRAGAEDAAGGRVVEDRGPGQFTGVASGMDALDGLARLLAGDEHRRRSGHLLHRRTEGTGQAQQGARQHQHCDEHLDEREAAF